MTATRQVSSLQLALSRQDAARALGMSLSHFKRHVQPQLRCVYSGSLRLYPVSELQGWLDRQSWQRSDAA